MSEIVIVPTYKRDELLYLCLEAIRQQDSEIEVFVFSDRGHYSAEHEEMSKQFHADFFWPEAYKTYGNSLNVISGMEFSLRTETKILHVIEDDTIIHPGYLAWSRVQLSRPGFATAAACGGVGNELDTWYTSPCASWNAGPLRRCLELVPPGYLEATTRTEMQRILDECPHFKKSKYRYGSAEQDGFFLRCIEHFGFKTKFPPKPLASHLGTYGYNRDSHKSPTGTFEERVDYFRKLMHDRQKRIEFFGQRITDAEMAGMEGL